ncbi:MAG: SdpI family protein [Deltaproteobacteria bacterium]|nr:SdpI family protein [Deltaproteobacteria bacterium]
MNEARPIWIRWGVPAGILWSSLLLSAWIYTRRFAQLPVEPQALVLVLLGPPGAGLILLLVVRGAARRAAQKGEPGETTDLVLIWAEACLFALHAAVLAVVLGVVSGLVRPVAASAALFFWGLAPLFWSIEHASPVGIRTPRTMAHPAAWTAAHRVLAVGLGLAGLVAVGASLLASIPWILAAVLAAGLSLLLGAATGQRSALMNPPAPPDVEEQKGPEHQDT